MPLVLLASLLVGSGMFALVVAGRRRGARRVKDLRAVLEVAYLEGGDSTLSPKEASHLLARAGIVAERALGKGSFFAAVRSRIERSDWKVTTGEFMAASTAAGAVGLFIGIASGSPVLAVLGTAAGLSLPFVAVVRSVSRRRSKFESQFPEVLDLLAAGLESGSSVAQALELVVAEAEDPAAAEFGRVLSATRLGVPIVDALRTMGERLGSRDLNWTVQAIVVQQRTGGRLADVLRTVAEFMRAREEVRRELRALVAEGKLSAYILGALPFAVAIYLLIVNPDYLNPLFSTFPGIVMVAGASVLMLIGFFAMSRIIKIEV